MATYTKTQLDAAVKAAVAAALAEVAVKAPARTLAQLRAAGAGGTCHTCGKTFATKNGYAYHMAHSGHAAK